MNLRTVHLIFITLSVLLAVGVAVWALGRPGGTASAAEMALGVVSILAAVGLTIYGISFRRRSRYW